MTYKRKAVSAEPSEPASRAKKQKKQQQFVDGADFYKFQVKQKRRPRNWRDARASLDAKKVPTKGTSRARWRPGARAGPAAPRDARRSARAASARCRAGPPRRAARPAVDGAFQISGQAHGAVEPFAILKAGEGQLRAAVGDDDAAVLARALGPDARVVRADGDGRPVLFSKLLRQSQYGSLGGAVALTSIRIEEDDPEPVVGAVRDRFQRAAIELVDRRVILDIPGAATTRPTHHKR